MKKTIGIYLAGSIKKGHENLDESFWTDEHMVTLKESFQQYQAVFLNPAFRKDNLSDHLSVFGRDMTQVFCSHFVLVDARARRGLGVGTEMMWAKMNRLPVVTWAPKGTHYHKEKTTLLGVPVENFIHPFVFSLSDKIVENLEEAVLWMENTLESGFAEIKGPDSIWHAMKYYQEGQLQEDTPMQEILQYSELKERLYRNQNESLLNSL